MLSRWALLPLLGAVACGGASRQQPIAVAGSGLDEGHGLLARASSRLLTSEDGDLEPLPTRGEVPRRYDPAYGGDAYGGDAYGSAFGGGAYGGATYASYAPPPWGYPSVNRMPHYQQQAGLTAAVEGTISWRGAIPKVTSACGTIDPLQIGSERGVGGVLVYIERFTTGRVLPNTMGEQRPSLVGGVVVKRGCMLAPTTQVVNPLPAQLAIHGDNKRTRVRLTLPGGVTKLSELQEAGRVALQLKTGVTRVDAEDGSLGAAWVVGVDTPYFAITDDAGRFRIDELAPGTYELTVWQPPIPTVTNGQLVYGPPITLRRSVRVDAARTSRLDVSLGK
ncbi:MAG: carboxypeptidase regulatory-like domain-containing protein [Myxococcales bacterium]|nr:carboxypeptidase regulatory-like domain-containing protein [Myxococcales bacterium]